MEGKRLAWSDTPIPKAAPANRSRSPRTREAAPAPAIPVSAPLALLERLASPGLGVEERQALRQDARDRLRSPADAFVAAAAVATGIAPGAPVDWASTPEPPDSAPALAVEVLRLARRQEAWRYLVRTATTPGAAAGDRAHVLLDGVPTAPVGVAAAEEVDAWSERARRGPGADLAKRLELLAGVVPSPPSVAVTAALLRLLVALSPHSGDGPARSAARAALHLLDRCPDETVERGLAATQLGEDDAARLLSGLAGHPAGPGSTRARLLRSFAAARPALVSGRAPWAGLDPVDLVHLVAMPAVGDLLTAPGGLLRDAVTVPLVEDLVDTLDLDGLLGSRRWPAPLVALVPRDRFTAALRAAATRESADLLAAALGAGDEAGPASSGAAAS